MQCVARHWPWRARLLSPRRNMTALRQLVAPSCPKCLTAANQPNTCLPSSTFASMDAYMTRVRTHLSMSLAFRAVMTSFVFAPSQDPGKQSLVPHTARRLDTKNRQHIPRYCTWKFPASPMPSLNLTSCLPACPPTSSPPTPTYPTHHPTPILCSSTTRPIHLPPPPPR